MVCGTKDNFTHRTQKSLPQGGRWHGVSRDGGSLQQAPKDSDAMGAVYQGN